jgi:hypothetical protein
MNNIVAKIMGVLRPSTSPRPNAGPEPSLDAKTHTYQVTPDGLSPTASSLEEFYEIQDTRHQAQEVFRTMQYAAELAEEDQSPLDADPREGHVKLPEHGFEAHPDSGFSLQQGEIHLVGNQSLIQTTSVSDNWMAKDQVGTWDKAEETFTLNFRPKPAPEFPSSPQHKIQSESVQADQKSRANDLVVAAQYWESKAQSLDNTANDINQRPSQVVAPGISTEAEPVMSETFYTEQADARSFEVFDLEQTADTTVVAGNRENGGRAFGARLTTHRDAESMKVTLERPEIGTTEKVEWVLSDGVLHYEKYKKG